MKIKQTPLGDIRPYPGNPRRDHDVERIAASIRAFGWRQPIVVWEGDGYVVAGHGRLLAAQHLGQAKAPVHIVPVSEMSESQARAYRIADNRSAEGSGWDERALLEEMALLDEGARRDAGFVEAEIDETRHRLAAEKAFLREIPIMEVDVSDIEDSFWIVVTGPLVEQAMALQKLRAVMKDLATVEVRLGTIQREKLGDEKVSVMER